MGLAPQLDYLGSGFAKSRLPDSSIQAGCGLIGDSGCILIDYSFTVGK
jgi:hypothetical protein